MTTKERIIQATKDYEEAKRLLHKSYTEKVLNNFLVQSAGKLMQILFLP